MKVNWSTVGKIASVVLSAAAGIVGVVSNMNENKKTTIETTEKLFKEYVENNK